MTERMSERSALHEIAQKHVWAFQVALIRDGEMPSLRLGLSDQSRCVGAAADEGLLHQHMKSRLQTGHALFEVQAVRRDDHCRIRLHDGERFAIGIERGDLCQSGEAIVSRRDCARGWVDQSNDANVINLGKLLEMFLAHASYTHNQHSYHIHHIVLSVDRRTCYMLSQALERRSSTLALLSDNGAQVIA